MEMKSQVPQKKGGSWLDELLLHFKGRNLLIIYNESLEVEIVGLRRMNVETECTVGKSLNLAHENLMKIQN
jgi:hypothetical protein